jgi:WD repeat-containing protein 48
MDPHNPSSSSSSQTNPQGSRATTPAGNEHDKKANKGQPSPQPDDLWEILCNDTVLPPNMTLAVVRQYVWRQSGEVVLHYRRKRSAVAAHGKD